jgi:LysM repeat protein
MGLTKATISREKSTKKVTCLFNPNAYTVSKSIKWDTQVVPGRDEPTLTFTGGGARTLTMELFFDSAESGLDVRTFVNGLWELASIDKNLEEPETKLGRPPLCIFQWGPNWSFEAALTSISVRYTLFKEDGTPLRATANVTFTEGRDGAPPTQAQENSAAQRAAPDKRRQVKEKDTVSSIAQQEYGDCAKWRTIANANNLNNPDDILPGQMLVIPADPEGDNETMDLLNAFREQAEKALGNGTRPPPNP